MMSDSCESVRHHAEVRDQTTRWPAPTTDSARTFSGQLDIHVRRRAVAPEPIGAVSASLRRAPRTRPVTIAPISEAFGEGNKLQDGAPALHLAGVLGVAVIPV